MAACWSSWSAWSELFRANFRRSVKWHSMRFSHEAFVGVKTKATLFALAQRRTSAFRCGL